MNGRLLAAAAVACAAGVVSAGSVTWPASPGKSCHAETVGGRNIKLNNVTHAQCAAACDAAKEGCGCFDMTAEGRCQGTREFWGFRASSDGTAYTNGTAPPPSPSPPGPPPPHPPPPAPLNPAVKKLALKYGTMRNETCAKAVARAPVLPAAASAAFMAAYQAFSGNNSEAAVLASARELLALPDVAAFFSLADSFSAPDGLDAMLVQCAVLSAASPLGLAEFAANGTAAEALVDQLLGDTIMMRDMLLAGGAAYGKYAEALQIFQKITQKSEDVRQLLTSASPPTGLWDDRSPGTMLRRLALGTALGHAEPIAVASFAHAPSTSFAHSPLRIHFTRAGFEWRRFHHAVCIARAYGEPHHSGRACA